MKGVKGKITLMLIALMLLVAFVPCINVYGASGRVYIGGMPIGVVFGEQEVKANSDNYAIASNSNSAVAGIGTITYIKSNGEFASLGHPITDLQKNLINVSGGKVYCCDIVGINKSLPKDAGELKGMIMKSSGEIGTTTINNKYGLYGKLDNIIPNNIDSRLIETAGYGEVCPGSAQIMTTIDDSGVKLYNIQIIKSILQKKEDDRGLVINITDKRLLAQTGGIVQGMSGSPIIQNGKLVGAVTHVFLNDPTRGYGMHIRFMLNQHK